MGFASEIWDESHLFWSLRQTDPARTFHFVLFFCPSGDHLHGILHPRISIHPGAWERDDIISGRAHPAPEPCKYVTTRTETSSCRDDF